MLTQIGICLMLIAILYLNVANALPVVSTNIEQGDQKRSSAALFGRFGVDPAYFYLNPPYYDDLNKDVIFHQKRQLKKKWAIAFPALIRTRR
jgi:hypothetical protein